MSGREVREYTNLRDPKDRKWGKGRDKIDDEDITFQRMVAKMQEVVGERGGYLHGRGALDSDDLLYLKEQMEAEEDAERLLRRTEKRAFTAFKRAASLADSSPALPLPLRVEPKSKSGIRQQDLLKNVLEIKPKRSRVPSDGIDAVYKSGTSSCPSDGHAFGRNTGSFSEMTKTVSPPPNKDLDPTTDPAKIQAKPDSGTTGVALLGLAYESSDEE